MVEKESKEFDSKVDSTLLSNKKAQQDSTFFSKIGNAFKKAIDCCKE